MKKFSNLISLLPCHSLEDFPVDGSREEAQSLLAAWTSIWHPQLIASAQRVPRWLSAFDTVSSEEEAEQYRDRYIQQHYYDDDVGGIEPEGDFEFDAEDFEQRWKDSLIVIPSVSRSVAFAGFEDAAASVGAEVVTDFKSRASVLEGLKIESAIDEALICDFFALAYIRLQVELMTRKLRYSSDLDCERFDETVLAAAKAAQEGGTEAAKERLQSAFDQLQEEKNQYYPVVADFVDSILLSDSLRAESINAELEGSVPKSFVATGSTLSSLAEKSPETIQVFADRVSDGSISFIAGPQHELPDDLLSLETVLGQLSNGLETFQETVGARPQVFMRRRAGLHASLPGILDGLGFAGVIYATLDQGSIPCSYSSSMRWMGVDGGALMAFGSMPLDASSDKSFLDLGVVIGGELDSAHVSTVFFARWPTQTCESFEDLKNSMKYGHVFGDFTDAATWFENVYDPGYGDSFEADEFESPWFEQAIASGSTRPVSTFVDYWANFYKLASVKSLVAILDLQDKEIENAALAQLSKIQNRIESQTKDWTSETSASVSDELDGLVQSLGTQLDCYAFNPLPWSRRASMVAESSSEKTGVVKGDGAIKLATMRDSVVELSGFGQLLQNPTNQIVPSELQQQPLVDDGESVLRNELFEVRVDRESGGIRGIHFYGVRGNFLSQRLAVRLVDLATREVTYSRMVCDSFEVKTLSPIASEIKTSGSLIDAEQNVLAKYSQAISLQRGRNVIDVLVELSDLGGLELSKSNYIVNRLAWSDESAELFCDIQGGRHAIRKPEIDAPHFIEIAEGKHRFALLTQGLPWHRRVTKKKLDSVLIAGNEKRRSFRFGIAVDSGSVMQQAVSEMCPLLIVDGKSPVAHTDKDANWTLHLANRNIVATNCLPVDDEDESLKAMRIRLLETEGNSGTLKLYCRRELISASKEALDGRHLRDITLDAQTDKDAFQYHVVEVEFAAREYFQLCLRWPKS
jgi:alpha-mannosidase